jgi:hypothetical protein
MTNPSTSNDNTILFNNSELIGANESIFSVGYIEMLRKHKYVESNMYLIHPIKKEETGHIFYKIKYKTNDLDIKIYDNNKEIEQSYYDPFEKDASVIKEKLKNVIICNEERQFKFDKTSKELDDFNSKLKKLAIDKTSLISEKQSLEKENIQLKKDFNRIQNIDEIHIEIDLLGQSKQGIEIIEKKYAILLSQMSLQSEVKMNLQQQYDEISPLVSKIRIIKDKMKKLKDANTELGFNMKRQEDMLPLIAIYDEKIKTNEKILNNLKDSIHRVLGKNSKINVDEQLRINYQERKLLEEKKMQLNLYKDVYDEESDEYYVRLIGSDPVMNKINREREEHWVDYYKNKIKEMNNVIEGLTRDITEMEIKEKEKLSRAIVIDPNLKLKKMDWIAKIEQIEKREAILINEVDSANGYFQQTINKLKERIELANKKIAKEIKFARNYNYAHM